MYNITPEKKLDFQEEKDAIINFCNKYWTVNEKKEEFVELVDFLFNFGIKLAHNCFNAVIIEREMDKIVHTDIKDIYSDNISKEEINNYIKKIKIKDSVNKVDKYLNEQECRYYDKYISKLLSEIKVKFPSLTTIMRVNWEQYLKDPESVYDDSKYTDFKGTELGIGLYIWIPFSECNTLSSLQYNNERSRPPFQSLIASIYYHAYALQINNNTLEIIDELKKVMNSSEIDNKSLSEIHINNASLKSFFDLATSSELPKQDRKIFEETVLSKLLEEDTSSKKYKM